ncbi:hypothetical protein [Priestia taiwanensis]|uniref:Replication protein n=1 Tax=Priestia taiwanensis TaxID=1347902 RepID=A0A917AQ30_9BACI|nr:hypothetical protein [Priestia taiwanensis]MBM7362713.1 hypothetical protein [Priestia taiwanensis]GGE64468.1 hypothetical protein GCM10007140_13360 [Priestia taiwanensis]
MNKLLLNEKPLIVLPSLACKYGLNEAILLQQLHYWLQESKNIRDGYTWVYNTYTDWGKQFPFWSERTIRRSILKLEERRVVVSNNFNRKKSDRTKWYRIDYKELHSLLNQHGQDGQPIKNDCLIPMVNLTTSIPENTADSALEINKDRKDIVGMPFPPIEDVSSVAKRFIELRRNGCHLTDSDYKGINKVLETSMAVNSAVKWLEECFDKYHSRSPKEGIRSFNYCVPYILDRYRESMRNRKNRVIERNKSYIAEDFNLDD